MVALSTGSKQRLVWTYRQIMQSSGMSCFCIFHSAEPNLTQRYFFRGLELTTGEKLDEGMRQLSSAQRRFHACHVCFPPGQPQLDSIPISKQICCQAPPLVIRGRLCWKRLQPHWRSLFTFSPIKTIGRYVWPDCSICLFSGFPWLPLGRLIGLDAMATVSRSVWSPQCMGNEPRCRDRRQEVGNNRQRKTVLTQTDEAKGGGARTKVLEQ